MEISVEDKIYILNPSDVLIFAPGTKYHLTNPKDSATILAVNFDYTFDNYDKNIPIPPDIPVVFKPENITEIVEISNFEQFNKPLYISGINTIKNDLEKTENIYRRQRKFFELKASSVFQGAIVKIARHILSGNEDIVRHSVDVNNIIDYIQENFHKNINNEHIGKTFNYHPNYVNNLIKEQTGYSLHEYVLTIRISRAIDLLETTDYKISEIAHLVGFEDPAYFSKYFKKATGKVPSAFTHNS
jgi:YesN/AraC family two-component response regulator